MKITTRNSKGHANGFLIPIWNSNETSYRPDQVYATTILGKSRKGPHLHMKRTGYFCCLHGNCEIVMRSPAGEYMRFKDLEDHRVVTVPPGHAAEIINTSPGWEIAVLVNLPSPAWSAEDPDEHEVKDWNPNV